MRMSSVDISNSSQASETHEEDERIELDDAFFANARVRKGGKVIREATGTLTKRGRPPKAEGERKEQITLRLSPQVLEFFRAGGEGWQTRIDEALAAFVAKRERYGSVRAGSPAVVRDSATGKFRSPGSARKVRPRRKA